MIGRWANFYLCASCKLTAGSRGSIRFESNPFASFLDGFVKHKTLMSMHVCAQSCPALCDPMDGSPPGSFVHGIFPGKNIGVGCHFLLHADEYELSTNTHRNMDDFINMTLSKRNQTPKYTYCMISNSGDP